MNFELAEIVPVNDTEKVLQVLELHLRGVAAEVVRSNGQITAYGIGPSPRVVNRRDTTVVAAASVDGCTRLTANVHYQASALLGNSPQNEIVKAKIEKVLNEMRAELKSPKPWIPRMELDPLPRAPEVVAEKLPPAKPNNIFSAQQAELFDKISFDAPSKPLFLKREAEVATPAPKYAAPVVEAAPIIHAVQEPLPSVSEVIVKSKAAGQKSSATHKSFTAKRSKSSITEPKVVAASVTASDIAARKTIESPPVRGVSGQIMAAKASAKDLKNSYKGPDRRTGPQMPMLHSTADGVKPVERRRIAPMIEVPLRGLLRARGPAIEDAVLARKWWKIVLAVAATLLLMTGVAGYLMRDQLPGPWRSAISAWSQQVRLALPGLHETNNVVQADTVSSEPVTKAVLVSKSVARSADEIATEPTGDAATDTVDAVTAAIHGVSGTMVRPETNIYKWVQDWSAAIQSRDPDAQASYYAHTVDHYLNHSRVNRAFILKDKAAQIGERSPVWTVSVDHVSVQKQNNAGLTVRAVKHMVASTGAGDSAETAVQVRLKLVRFEGTWKIVEEQEVS